MTILLAMLRFGLQDLLKQWKLGFAMALVLATSYTGYICLQAYQSSIANTFRTLPPGFLQIAEFGSVGGRMPTSIEAELVELGARQAIPEIHTVVGTSPQDAVLLRGVDPERYRQLQPLELLAGEALDSAAAKRSTMLGWRLAQRLSASPGSEVQLRGRTFRVTGVFRTDTFVDNEAWVSLQDAQELLGWAESVTSYLVPDEGVLKVGMLEADSLPPGLAALPRGESIRSSFEDYAVLLDLFAAVIQFIGAAAMLILINVLLRLAWLHRYEMAVLRAAGFPRRAFASYLASQAACITLAGLLLGGAGALAISQGVDLWINGYELQAEFSGQVLTNSLLWAGAITLPGSLLPAWWLGRSSPAQLLRARSAKENYLIIKEAVMKYRLTIILTMLLFSALACNLPIVGGQSPSSPPAEAAPSQPASQPEADPQAPANQAAQAPNQPQPTQAPPTPTPKPLDPKPVGVRQGLASLNTFQLVAINKTSGPGPLDHSETRVEMTGDNPNDAVVIYNRSSSISAEYPEPDVSESYQYTVGLETCEGFGEEWDYESSTPAEKELRDAMMGLSDILIFAPGAEYAGTENVNGVESNHFSFRLEGLGAESGSVVTANQGDYWIAVDGQYLVRYQLLLEFSNSAEETYRMEVNVELTQINQPVNIALPAACLASSSTP